MPTVNGMSLFYSGQTGNHRDILRTTATDPKRSCDTCRTQASLFTLGLTAGRFYQTSFNAISSRTKALNAAANLMIDAHRDEPIGDLRRPECLFRHLMAAE